MGMSLGHGAAEAHGAGTDECVKRVANLHEGAVGDMPFLYQTIEWGMDHGVFQPLPGDAQLRSSHADLGDLFPDGVDRSSMFGLCSTLGRDRLVHFFLSHGVAGMKL